MLNVQFVSLLHIEKLQNLRIFHRKIGRQNCKQQGSMASAGRCLWTTSGTGGRGGRHSPIFKLPWESVAIHTNGPPQISLSLVDCGE